MLILAAGEEREGIRSKCGRASGCCRMWGCKHVRDIAVVGKHVNYRHCDANSNTYHDAHSGPNSRSNANAGCCPSADTGTSSSTSTGSCVQGSSAEQSVGI